ncbi:MAG: RNA polymerase sigma factor for flagellar operon FliA [Planctomycetota bacterium]
MDHPIDISVSPKTDAALLEDCAQPVALPREERKVMPRAARSVLNPSSSRTDENAKPRVPVTEQTHPELWAVYHSAPSTERRNDLVVAYQGLVRDVVRRFSARLPRSVDRGDLITAGSVGLMSAIEGFDPERGVRFESYCELRVKGALLDELRTQDWLPRPWRQRVERQKRTMEALRANLGRRPHDDEVADSMGIDIETYSQIFGTGLPNAPTGSMTGGEDEEAGPTLEVVPDRNLEPLGESLSRQELLALVAQKLTQQEYRIVYLKYWEELPMREIGELTGLSESRVCKIHAKLIGRLRDRFRSDSPGE